MSAFSQSMSVGYADVVFLGDFSDEQSGTFDFCSLFLAESGTTTTLRAVEFGMVRDGHQLQMVKTNADWLFAKMMQDQAIRDWPISELPSHQVSEGGWETIYGSRPAVLATSTPSPSVADGDITKVFLNKGLGLASLVPEHKPARLPLDISVAVISARRNLCRLLATTFAQASYCVHQGLSSLVEVTRMGQWVRSPLALSYHQGGGLH